MKLPATIPLFILLFVIGSAVEGATSWTTFDGQTIHGDPTAFDFETKTVTIANPDSGANVSYNTKDLNFHSKRRLLVSKVFHNSFPGGGGLWPKEKITLFAIAILSPVLLMIIGMWLAGLFVARRFNPFSAVGAFIGSWIAGVILVVCYLIIAAKSSGGAGLVWIGVAVATLVMAMFISAIYKTTFVKGIIIFIGHLLFAALLGFFCIYGADTLLPPDEVSGFWEQWVFKPTGLVDGPPREGY